MISANIYCVRSITVLPEVIADNVAIVYNSIAIVDNVAIVDKSAVVVYNVAVVDNTIATGN